MKALPSQQTEMFQPERKSYHNTVCESPADVRAYEAVAAKQDSKILAFMVTATDRRDFTSDEIQKFFPTMLLTSVRRALTNLMKAGYVEDTGNKRKGSFGRNAIIWRLRNQSLNK